MMKKINQMAHLTRADFFLWNPRAVMGNELVRNRECEAGGLSEEGLGRQAVTNRPTAVPVHRCP